MPALIYLCLTVCPFIRLSGNNSSTSGPVGSKKGQQLVYLKDNLGRLMWKLYQLEAATSQLVG